MTDHAAAVEGVEPLECRRCDLPIDAQEQGGYVEQVALGRVRTPYHRRCWDENEHALDTSELTALRAQHAALVEALIWCSGSADFNEGGKAREGWLKICAPLLATLGAPEGT